MKSDLKKLLERIFMGEVPSSVSFIDDDSTIEALKRQGVIIAPNGKFPQDVFNINYVRFIQDVAEIKKEKKVKEPEIENVEDLQHSLGILMRSSYLEFIQDVKKGDDEKLFLTFFIRKFLLTYQQIYHVEIIEDQANFIYDLYGMEEHYYKVEKERLETVKAEFYKPFELSDKWPYNVELLNKLSLELFNDGYTDAPLALMSAFDSNYSKKCNWIKERTSLLFLLWLLLDKGTEKPSDLVIDVCCKRFTVKGRHTSRKVALSTNIQKQINSNISDLKGKFLHLQNLYHDLGFQ